MGFLGGTLKIVGLLVLALVGLGTFLYLTDYQVEGEITGKDPQGRHVTIKPRLVPREFQVDLEPSASPFVCVGYEVTFRVNTRHYQVLDPEGRLIYDSESGLNDGITPLRCSGAIGV